MTHRLYITFMIALLSNPVMADESSADESVMEQQRLLYDEYRIKKKDNRAEVTSDGFTAMIEQRLINHEKRIQFLEDRLRTMIRDNNGFQGLNEIPQDERNKGFYKLDKNTENLNQNGFFILE